MPAPIAYEIFSIVAMLLLAGIYVIYDILNDRNIPLWIVLTGLISGLVYNLAHFGLSQLSFISLSFPAALIAIGMGFNYSKRLKDKIGLADFFLLATIILFMPITPSPLLLHVWQGGIPFLFTLLINSMPIALIYAIWLAAKRQRHMPLAVPIFVSLIISLLIGNMVLL